MDHDFGALAAKAVPPLDAGIVLLRLQGSDPAILSRRVVSAIASRDDWMGYFSVIEDGRIRMRPIAWSK